MTAVHVCGSAEPKNVQICMIIVYKRMLVRKIRRISVIHHELSSWARESGECSQHNVVIEEKQKFVTFESVLKSRLYSKGSVVSERDDREMKAHL